MSTQQRGNLFRRGWIDTIPLVVACIPFGILYGAMAASSGLDLAATLGMSLFVYAGASQFIAVSRHLQPRFL